MDKHTQLTKILCVCLIFTILIYFSGCYSSRVAISRTDLPLPDSNIYYYVIHTQNSNYLVKNGLISNGILSGKGKIDNGLSYSNKIHIFLSSDTIMKVSPEKIISIPIDGIVKVVAVKAAYGKTIALVTGVAGGLIIVSYATFIIIVNNLFRGPFF